MSTICPPETTDTTLCALFDSFPSAMVVINREGRITTVNRQAIQLSRELLGKEIRTGLRFKTLADRLGLPDYVTHINKALAGEPVSLEEVYTGVSGQNEWLEINFTPIVEGSQTINAVCFTAKIITKHKQTEKALAFNLQTNQAFLDVIPDILLKIDRQGNFVDARASDSAPLLQNPESFIGKNCTEVLPPELATKTLDMVARTFETGKLQVINYQLDIGGFVGSFEARLVVSTADEVLIIVRDTTERQQVENVLQRYRLLSENTLDIILFIKPDGTIIEANKAASLSYGYSLEELQSLNIRDLRAVETIPLVSGQMQKACESGLLFETIHRRKEGRTFPVEVSSHGIELDGEMVLLSVIRDITERKQAEEAHRQSDELYRALASNLPSSAVLVFDQNFRHLVAKGADLPGLHFFSEAVEGKTLQEILPPDEIDRLLPHYQSALSGVESSFESIYQDSVYLMRVAPLRNSRQEIFAGMLLCSDITALKKSEKALQESEQLLKTVINNAPIMLMATNETGKITLVEGKALNQIGLQPGQNVGHSMFHHSGHPTEVSEAMQAALQGKSTTIVTTMNGVTFETWCAPIVDRNQHISGATGVAVDITDRVQAERSLRDSENRYRSVVSNIKEVIFQTDAEGLWLFLNPAWTEITGFTLEESLGQNFLNYVHPDDRQRNLDLFMPLIERKKDYCRHQVRYLTKDDKFRWIEVYARLTLDENDNIIGTSGTLRDVTDPRLAEEALRYRFEFEQLLATISSSFINLAADEIDEEINQALALIGQFAKADRSYIFLFSDDRKLMSNTHEWCNEGIEPQIEFLQDMVTEEFSWLMQRIYRLENIHLPSLDLIGPDGQTEREVLEMQSIQSLLLVPLVYERQAVGYMGFDAVQASRTWSNDDIGLLRIVGETFTSAIKRKFTEQALIEQRDFAQLVLKNMGQGLTIADKEGHFQFVNQAYANMTGYTPEELLGKSPFDFTLTEDLDVLHDALRTRLKGNSTTYETRLRQRDGGVRYVTVTGVPLAHRQGGIKEIVSVVTDLTERRRDEELLRESEQRLRTVVTNVPLLLFALDQEGIITFAEGRGFTVAGLSSQEFLGRSMFEINRSFGEDFRAALGGENVHTTHEVGPRFFETWYSPVKDAQNNVTGVIGVAVDISDRIRAEQEVQQALEKEKELSTLKSSFISMASHEFRTPLTVINTSAELIQNYGHKFTYERSQELYKRIQVAVKNMTQLLDEVLLISKSDAGKLEFKPEFINLTEFSKNLLEEIELGPGSNHKFQLFIHRSKTLVRADEKLLRQILVNLLTNAIKYSPKGSTINFYLSFKQDTAQFKIQDEGMGIPPEGIKQLFQSFYRASNVGDIKGTGLGLAIVKRCVDAHKGTIKVTSQLEKGTVFTVVVPTSFQEEA